MEIGKFIKELRLKKGLTQEELAEKTDISVRTIQRIENGEVDPRLYTLQSIASVLDIEYEELANHGKEDSDDKKAMQKNIWLPLLHLSGLLFLVFPPIIIWIWKKDEIENIKEHAIDVINFQLSMFIYFIAAGFLVFILIGLPIVMLLGIYSTVIIIINTIKVANNQPYKYPITINIIKP